MNLHFDLCRHTVPPSTLGCLWGCPVGLLVGSLVKRAYKAMTLAFKTKSLRLFAQRLC